MEVEEQDADPDHDCHLEQEDEQAHRHLRDDEIVRTDRRDPETPEDPALFEGNESERDAEDPHLHDGHREDPGKKEVHVREVPRFERERRERSPPESRGTGECRFVKHPLENKPPELRHLRLRLKVAVGRHLRRRRGGIPGRDEENEVPLPFRKLSHLRFPRPFGDLECPHGLNAGEKIGTGCARLVDDPQPDASHPVEPHEPEEDHDKEGEQQCPENRLALTHEHLHRGERQHPFNSHRVPSITRGGAEVLYSSLIVCPVRLRKTSSRLACLSTFSFRNPPARSVVIISCGGAIAMIFPASMIATRSQSSSASSM